MSEREHVVVLDDPIAAADELLTSLESLTDKINDVVWELQKQHVQLDRLEKDQTRLSHNVERLLGAV